MLLAEFALIYTAIKDPQWYAVQRSDTTMFIKAPLHGQRLFIY